MLSKRNSRSYKYLFVEWNSNEMATFSKDIKNSIYDINYALEKVILCLPLEFRRLFFYV